MKSGSSWGMVRVLMDVNVLGGVQFVSPVMEPHLADMLLIELSREVKEEEAE